MRFAVLYARVSSKDQEREGFSIPAQLKLLREYAVRLGFVIVREFVDIERAQTSGRQYFNEMVPFCAKKTNPKIILVEKTDRWERHTKAWIENEQEILAQLSHAQAPSEDRVLDAQRTLELADKAYSLYLTRTPAEQAELLRLVL